MARQHKKIANRPSQADQEFVRNSRGEKVRNLAYDPKKSLRGNATTFGVARDDFSRFEKPTLEDTCEENINTLSVVGDSCFTRKGALTKEDVTQIKEIMSPYIASQTPNLQDDTAEELTKEYYNQGMFIRSNNLTFLPVTPGSSPAYGVDIDPSDSSPMHDNTPDSITFQERQAVEGGNEDDVRYDYIGMTWGSKKAGGSLSTTVTSDYTMRSWYDPEKESRVSVFLDESHDDKIVTTEHYHDGTVYTTEARPGKNLGLDPVTGATIISVEQKALLDGPIVERNVLGTKDGQTYRQRTVTGKDGSTTVSTSDSNGNTIKFYDKEGNEI